VNGYDRRTAVLLEEMRIGPLWTPRALAQEAVAANAHAEPELGSGLASERDIPVIHSPAAVPAQGTQSTPQIGAAPSAHVAPAPATAGIPPTGPVSGSAAPVDSAWDDDDVAPMPAPRTRAAAAPSSPPTLAQDDGDGVSEAAIASMDWPQLRAAIQSCRRCEACRSGDARVLGQGPQRSVWMAVAGAPAPEDVAQGAPLAGEGGKLLENMLGAIGVDTASVYVTQAIKCRPAGPDGAARAPRPEQIAACRPYLQRELELTGARTVLAMGQIAANTLLERPLQEPLASARGRPHACGEAAVVTTLHPRELLVRGQDKALAWADLCLAARTHGRAH
jgi:DNA polymerase